MGNTEVVRRGYDTLAATYAARSSASKREITVFEEFVSSLSDSTRILDAGCGHGTPALHRVCEEQTVVGLDFSRELLRIAIESVSGARFVQGNMTGLPFQNETFDTVISHRSLIHIPLADHQSVLDEFARVLRPGGGVLVSEAPEAFDRRTQDWLDRGVEMTWTMAGTNATHQRLQDAGFTVTKTWDTPERTAEDDPEPSFIAARI